MTNEKILEVLDLYEAKLSEKYYDTEEFDHIRNMIPRAREFVKEGRREKVMRWLGFVQGVFWVRKLYTIEEMKEHNRERLPDQADES